MPKERRKLLREMSRRHFNRLVRKSCLSETNCCIGVGLDSVSHKSSLQTRPSSIDDPQPSCSTDRPTLDRPRLSSSATSSRMPTSLAVGLPLSLDEPDISLSDGSSICSPTPTTRSSNESDSSHISTPRSSCLPSQEDNTTVSEAGIPVVPILSQDNDDKIVDPAQQSDLQTMKSSLAQWALKYQNTVYHNCLNDLLGVLRNHPCFSNLPKDSRTLLDTPRTVVIEDMPPGKYHHFGLKSGLINLFLGSDLNSPDILKLLVGVDGLPISVSSKSELWPIMCHAINCPESTIFPIGIYHGKSKPADANLFLKQFVDEAVDLCTHGLLIRGKIVQICIWGLICDVPAKSFISHTKSHTAFYSCSKCCVEGHYKDNRVCFPDINAPKRTHEDFVSHRQEEHHTGHSILELLPNFNIIDNIPLDYMHLICLGVVRKLVRDLWVHGKVPFKLPFRKVEEASMVLISLKSFIPMEFARKPRELQEISRWKATELRQFLLYTGPIVLASVLSSDKYLHFMSLHVAVRILASKEFGDSIQLHVYAKSLLTHFVEMFPILYDVKYVSHNVHALIHVADDVNKYGPLDAYSAFRFENFMQPLKNLLRKAESPLGQLARRYYEKQAHTKSTGQKVKSDFGGMHNNGPLILGCTDPQYSISHINNNFTVSVKEPNNCVGFLDGSIAVIKNICFSTQHEAIVCVGKKFGNKTNLYERPCDSSLLHTYKVSRFPEYLQCWPIRDIVTKFVKLPLTGCSNEDYAVFPILHSDSIN